jgi:hypothetical protein
VTGAHRTSGNPSPGGRRVQRRQATVSHWPPEPLEVIGGRHVRQLTRAQREQIAELLKTESWGAFGLQADIEAVIDGRESPTRRLARLLAAAQEAS